MAQRPDASTSSAAATDTRGVDNPLAIGWQMIARGLAKSGSREYYDDDADHNHR
jgi:hypothetical protein